MPGSAPTLLGLAALQRKRIKEGGPGGQQTLLGLQVFGISSNLARGPCSS